MTSTLNPPSDLSKPTVDAEDGNTPIGWRWCRHELENYLIEPLLVSEATGWPISEIDDAICGFGHRFGQKPSFSVREYSDALDGQKTQFLGGPIDD